MKKQDNLTPLFELGSKGDRLLNEKKYQDAHQTYVQLISEIERHGQVDSYVIAKTTLGLLLALIRLGRLDRAFAIWNAHMEESLFGVGIFALENAQTNLNDIIVYDCVCAFLHSVRDVEPRECGHAVNQYMSRVCEHSVERGDRKLMEMALSNWKNHLREVFGSSLPHQFAAPLIEFEREFGAVVKPRALDFPSPAPWGRPDSFREMSRVVDFNLLRFEREPKREKGEQEPAFEGATARRLHKK